MSIADIDIEPAVGMEVIGKRNASIYRIEKVFEHEVRLIPKWAGRGSRATWKTRTHLWNDYRIYLGSEQQ